jgi:hypothetical protein
MIKRVCKRIVEELEKSGRWSVGRLEKVVVKISEKVGGHFRSSWDAAWALHVWASTKRSSTPRT